MSMDADQIVAPIQPVVKNKLDNETNKQKNHIVNINNEHSNDDYVDTDVMDPVKKGVKICLELLTEEKYKYKFF